MSVNDAIAVYKAYQVQPIGDFRQWDGIFAAAQLEQLRVQAFDQLPVHVVDEDGVYFMGNFQGDYFPGGIRV